MKQLDSLLQTTLKDKVKQKTTIQSKTIGFDVSNVFIYTENAAIRCAVASCIV